MPSPKYQELVSYSMKTSQPRIPRQPSLRVYFPLRVIPNGIDAEEMAVHRVAALTSVVGRELINPNIFRPFDIIAAKVVVDQRWVLPWHPWVVIDRPHSLYHP